MYILFCFETVVPSVYKYIYIFNFIEKIAPDNIHHNNQKSSIIFTMAKDQSQVMIKKQQQDQEPFDNGHMSSAKTSSEDTCVEQTTAIVTHELLKTEKIDVDEPPSLVDDVINVCKVIIRNFIFVLTYLRIRKLKIKFSKCILENRYMYQMFNIT